MQASVIAMHEHDPYAILELLNYLLGFVEIGDHLIFNLLNAEDMNEDN